MYQDRDQNTTKEFATRIIVELLTVTTTLSRSIVISETPKQTITFLQMENAFQKSLVSI